MQREKRDRGRRKEDTKQEIVLGCHLTLGTGSKS